MDAILLTSLKKKEKRKHLSDYLVLYVTGPRLQLSSLPLLSLGSYDNSSAIPYATQTITLMTVHHTALHCYLGIHILVFLRDGERLLHFQAE